MTKKLLGIFPTNMNTKMKTCHLVSLGSLVIINIVIGVFYLQPKNSIYFSKTKDSGTCTNQYIIENAKFCSRDIDEQKLLPLAIFVHSAVNHFKNRQAIRNTWGSVAYANRNTGSIKLAFLLGSTNDTSIQKLVMEESLQHTDIIQGNFSDTYRNLTLKAIMFLKWVNKHCKNVNFILKTDDDMYINVAKLLHTLTQLPMKSNVMYGYLLHETKPIRINTSKWYVPKELFQDEIYPDYLSGRAYVLSGDIIPKLYEVSFTLPLISLEDVFITGLCANKVGVQRYHVHSLSWERQKPTRSAFEKVISGHQEIKDMNTIWTELQKPKPIYGVSIRNTTS